MTINEILASAIQILKRNKIKFPHLEAEILLSHILKKPREFILAHPEFQLTKKEVASYKLRVTRRLKGIPIAYLIGEKEFYGLNFFVNKNVLIPRPETEMMIDEILKLVTYSLKPVTMIDVGTGSGCIAITLAKSLQGFPPRVDSRQRAEAGRFYATDVSKHALAVAKKNAKLNGVLKKIKFLRGDLLKPFISSRFQVPSSKIIAANLPYLTPAQIKSSPSIRYEPKLALSAGHDGLKYYRRLFKQISRAGWKNLILLCEIDPNQKNSIRRLAKSILPPHRLEIKKDLRGHNRLVIIKIV